MLIKDEAERIVQLQSIHVPTISTHFWTLDLQQHDFMLAPLKVLEESWCPCLTVEVEGYMFQIPAKWNVLIVDPDTSQLDLVEFERFSCESFKVAIYNEARHLIYPASIKVVDYSSEEHVVNPALNRHHMLCHPVATKKWICLAPNDSYNKFLRQTVIGDLL